ncbi:hypothetical protein NXF25_018641 [Crotalus adamanteus]|uniref:Uncharacterized protein n=1 Tax=Crotalus adamanteus TaxID=8729 RepID=A0AAW1AP43_CROAD
MGGCWQLVFACCLLVQRLSAEDNTTSAVNPDEELEKNIVQRIASLREMGQDEISNFTDLALQYYNQQEESMFIPLKNPTVTVKKAIGSTLDLQMIVERTNCTKKDVKRRFRSPFDSEGEPPKYCVPLPNPEQLNCKFHIFKDERSYSEAIVGHDCKPIKIIDKEILNVEDTKSPY